MKTMMIYGATGYTGSMIVKHALDSGIPVTIAGRNEDKLVAMASELNLSYKVFSLENPAEIDEALANVTVLLNCAGPFAYTADALINAAVRNKIHYLDIAAERVKYPVSISLALNVAGSMSRGSAVSAMENLSPECLIRLNGQLVPKDPGELRTFDFGSGARECFPVTLPDLVTVWKTTGIPDISTFVHVSGIGFPQGDLSTLPDGPSAKERESSRYQAVAEIVDAEGKTVQMLLDTVNGYSFTAIAAAEAARRVLAGDAKPGFQTPADLFGKHFAETIADTRITQL